MPETKQTARLKAELPEFRDVSVWKGRLGLTRFSPDGKYLAVSAKSVDIVIYDTATGEIKSKIDGKGFAGFSFSRDGKNAVVQDKDTLEIRIFDVESGKLVREIRGLGAASYVGKKFGGPGLFNIMGMQGTEDTPYEMDEAAVSPDWKNVLVNKNDKEFALYDFETGKLKYELNHQNFNTAWETTKLLFAGIGMLAGTPGGILFLGSVSNTQFSNDGKHLIIANGNRNPTLWNVQEGKLISKFNFKDKVLNVRFSPDGKMIAASDYAGIITVSDAETGEIISTLGSKKDRRSLSNWSADSQTIFSVPRLFGKGDAKVHNAKNGELLFTLEKSDTYAVFPSNKGNLLITLPRKNKNVYFQIWESATGTLIATVPRPKDKKSVTAVRWSPNDEIFATSSGLKDAVELWNAKGELLQTPANAAFPMQFSADGKLLLTGGKKSGSGSQKDTGYLWEITDGN